MAMDRIETEALYDERGEVCWARPLLQGDVFDGVVLPGFGDTPRKVQIVAHPCAMRAGSDLTPRITVAPVEIHTAVTGVGWQGHLRVMPLAELTDGQHYATRFIDVTACPSGLLTRANRIASLSDRGIYVLQQRLIKHYTRVEMGLDVLRSQSAPVLTEAQIVWDWLETALPEDQHQDEEALNSESAFCETWLRSGDPSPQARLQLEINHADVRREAKRAAAERAQNRGQGS